MIVGAVLALIVCGTLHWVGLQYHLNGAPLAWLLAPGLTAAFYHDLRRDFSWTAGLTFLATVLMLGAFVAPNFIRARSRGQLTACKSNLKNIGTALEMYSTDNAGLYPRYLERLTPNYLKTIPTCPSVGEVTYWCRTSAKPDLYTVVCEGLHHKGAGIQSPHYPQYTSVTGLIERP